MNGGPKIWEWFSESRVTYWLKVFLLIVLGFYILSGILEFLARIESISVLIIAAIFVAYILYPVVRWLNSRLPLVAAILIVYALLALLVALAVLFALPRLSSDVSQVIAGYPVVIHAIQKSAADPNNAVFRHFPPAVRSYVLSLPALIGGWFRTHGLDATMGAFGLLMGTVGALIALVVVPVLSAYILLDSESIKRYTVALIPRAKRENALVLLTELEQVLGGFIRGQILVAITVGILITIMLEVMHVPYALLIGVSAAVLDVIPYIGAVATFIPAVLLAFFTGGMTHAVIVGALFIAIFEAEGHLIAPNIVSKTVSLSPLAVLLAILIGGELMGVIGMFIAVPVAGMLRVLAMHVMPKKASLEEAQPALTEEPRIETPLEVEPQTGA